MDPNTAIAHFGSAVELARKLGCSKQAVSNWKRVGIVPELQARRLHELTRGKLKFDKSLYPAERIAS